MIKIFNFIFLTILIIAINSCVGYEPIFSSSNMKIRIIEHSVEGNKKLGNQIYSKLHSISKSNENNVDAQDIDVFIKISKEKNTTIKSSTGKILEYKVNINTSILVLNSLNKKKLLDQSYNLSESYKVQDQKKLYHQIIYLIKILKYIHKRLKFYEPILETIPSRVTLHESDLLYNHKKLFF